MEKNRVLRLFQPQYGDFGPIALVRTNHFILTTFGLLIGLGFFLAAMHAWFYLGFRSIEIPVAHLIRIGLWLSITIPGGAYLMARILDLPNLLRGKMSLGQFLRIPGFALWGGLFSGIFTILISALTFGWSPLKLIDAITFGMPLAQMLGRLGCLNYGCCHGKPCPSSHRKLTIRYRHPEAKVLRTYSHLKNVPLYPTQLYSAIANLAIYLTMVAITFIFPQAPIGTLTGLYLFLYGTKRFVIEYYRGEHPRTNLLNLTLWQWFSVGFAAAGLTIGLTVMPGSFMPDMPQTIANGIKMARILAPATIVGTMIITFIYSLHGRRIGSW